MKKLVYTAPEVEITKWQSQDIITSSGGSLTVSTSATSIGDDNTDVVVADYGDL